MTKTEFREAVRSLLSESIMGLSLDDKLAIVQQCLVDAQLTSGFDESNKGKPWTDEELRVVFQYAPTKANCILLARANRKRGIGKGNRKRCQDPFRIQAKQPVRLPESGLEQSRGSQDREGENSGYGVAASPVAKRRGQYCSKDQCRFSKTSN